MTPRERQEAIYKAEHEALTPISRELSTKAEVEDYLCDVAERVGFLPPDIDWRSGSMQSAAASDGIIHLPNNPFGRSVCTILHEAAHATVGCVHKHNNVWLDAYLDMIRSEMGVVAWASFIHSLKVRGVNLTMARR